MEESILITIKKMLGLESDYDAFNTDIVVYLNSAMMTLQQLGVGPAAGLIITGDTEKWSDLIPEGMMLEGVKTYLYLCVKMVFDPPASSFVMDAMNRQKEELEWRLRDQAELYPGDGTRLGYYQELDANAQDSSIDSAGVHGPFNVIGGDG